MVCDETGHSGNLVPTTVTLGSNMDGTPNLQIINMPCPDLCGVVSSHPIIDGAMAPYIQELFTRFIAKFGCPCGVLKKNSTLPDAVAHAQLEVQRIRPNSWVAGVIV